MPTEINDFHDLDALLNNTSLDAKEVSTSLRLLEQFARRERDLEMALDHIIAIVDKLSSAVFSASPWSSRSCHCKLCDITSFFGMDVILATDVLACRSQALTGDGGKWDAAAISRRLEVVETKAEAIHIDKLNLFPRSRTILRACLRRREASVIALKATGHRLPMELVELVQDKIFSEQQLKEDVAAAVAQAEATLKYKGW